jgi:sarcosine oxidase
MPSPRTQRPRDPVTITSDVAVVGAGIVGLATADAVRRRGASVHVYERGTPGGGQSGASRGSFATPTTTRV